MRHRRGGILVGSGWLGLMLLALSLTACAAFGTELGFATGSAVVSWTPPVTSANGTKLTNLAGYDIYYGLNPSALTCRVRIANVHVTRYAVRDLSGGRWYFAVTAYTTSGAQSVPSNVVSKVIPGPQLQPVAPGGGRCQLCRSC